MAEIGNTFFYKLIPSDEITTRKTYFYRFIPSEAEEETFQVNNIPRIVTRELIEARDIYPAPKIDMINPWKIKKKITREEVDHGELVIPFFETFEYIIRYWNLYASTGLTKGDGMRFKLWDVTTDNEPKKYEPRSVCFMKMLNDDYSLWCTELFSARGLGVGDEIGLYWDPTCSSLVFKLLSRVRDSRI